MFTDLLLHERLLKALDHINMQQPTPVQAVTIPAALAGRDLMVSAKTGSGKTAAFLLPILHRFITHDAPNSGTRALILVPTRELARQVFKQAKQLASFTRIESALIVGGDDFRYQRALLRKNPEIVIATPGRLKEQLERNSLDLNDLEVLVLDEADRMLDMGFSEEVLSIASACNPSRQTLLLSATLNHQGIRGVAKEILQEPEALLLDSAQELPETIEQQIILADDAAFKEKLLVRLLSDEPYQKALVFTNTRIQAQHLGSLMRFHKEHVGVLHGEMAQEERNKVMDQLRRGRITLLIATDVAARGLDIKEIDLVINFDMARNSDDYVHRIGRTGRAGATGKAISMITPPEWNLMIRVQNYLGQSFTKRAIDGLTAKYKGPKKTKASGKAAGSKKKKSSVKTSSGSNKAKTRSKPVKQRKRQAPAPSAGGSRLGDGTAPLRRSRS